MKSLLSLTLLLVGSATVACSSMAASPTQVSIPIDLGPKAYRTGDAIEITEVTATSPRLEQGDSVTITGTYHLKSQATAHLSLNLTATAGDGISTTIPESTMLVKKGQGKFKLKTLIRSPGHLHVTYYDPTRGKPLGGTYFGTAEQMKEIAHRSVDYYLADEKPQQRPSANRKELAELRLRVRTLEQRLQELNRKFDELH